MKGELVFRKITSIEDMMMNSLIRMIMSSI